MKIYKIWQEVNNGYDTYSDFIVYAENEEEAKLVYPLDKDCCGSWVQNIKDIKVEYLGEAKKGAKKGKIAESFHAG